MTEKIQKQSFERLGDQYLLHYNDLYSTNYRRKFIFGPMVEGIDLNGRVVLDAMCGSGQITEFLLTRKCRIHALDLSEKQIQLYKERFPGIDSKVESILNTRYPDNYFDVVIICGGLHHVQPYTLKAVKEVQRILKPGGFFVFCEPHAGSVVDKLRRLWYRRDKFFMENEASINYDHLEKIFSRNFKPVGTGYFGNIAYYLIYNSLILRIPLCLKKWIAPPAFFLEDLLMPLHTPFLSSYMIVRWQKR